MFDVLKTRIAQKHRTARYPKVAPSLPDRFKGMPQIDPSKCNAACTGTCKTACPVNAINGPAASISIDTGACIFCGTCETTCAAGCITFTGDHRLAMRNRKDLCISSANGTPAVRRLDDERLRLFRRSFRLRQVSAGGCNACEADTNVLTTPVFDLSRFGIQFVASPRHADGLLITGPVTKNMAAALKKTYDATPAPKVVIALGACAISGGMFADHTQVHRGADGLLPVDLYIPGCPPHPYTILDGLLRLLGRIG
jgi:Ni,Fe-hydrogenase III small subunit/ferredoxin